MRRLLVSSILITGLAMTGAAGAISAEQMGDTQSGIYETENTQQHMYSESLNKEGQEYTVKSGDTLASISEEFFGSSDKWEIIARANGIESPDQLEVGQTIIIPAANVRSEAGINSGEREHSYTEQNTDEPMNWESEMKGEVTEIATGNESLTITDENGDSHSLKLEDSEMLDGVSVGDFVKVEIDGGTVISLEKVEKKA
jgi:LysM repeat protein